MGIRRRAPFQTPRRGGGAGVSRRLLGAALAVALAATPLASVGPAGAAFPGANGKIAFASDRDGDLEIFVINPDGSGETQLTFNTAAVTQHATDTNPVWSPDGAKIAFVSHRDGDSEIFVMNPDGSEETQLTFNTASDVDPAWSPDGTKIAFASGRNGETEIFIMKPDGSDQVRTAFGADPEWSPDGTKIAFVSFQDGDPDIFVMNADGSDQTQRTFNTSFDFAPDWSPDGTKIAFQSDREGGNYEIFVMNDDSGSAQTQLTFTGTPEFHPAWSPDGTKIAFAGADPFFAIFVMNPNGSDRTQLTSGTGGNLYPDWQPILIPSSTSLKVIKKERRVVAKGLVSPNHAGGRVVVKLFERRGGKFVLLATIRPMLDPSSRYVARFGRPAPGRCLVKARFGSDGDHLPSVARQKFRC